MSKSRKLEMKTGYTPFPVRENGEVFRNGIFKFNISRIVEDIQNGNLEVIKEQIDVQDWFTSHHFHGSINEEHLPSVDTTKTIIQAEISPGIFTIIDGNHRIEKAFREGVEFIDSYKLRVEQILPYFVETRGYEAFIPYWNSKLEDKEMWDRFRKNR